MQSTSFPSIRRFFMSLEEVEGKMKEIERNNFVLEGLIDNKIVENIQEAVNQRMGPYMCDNSLEESKTEQSDFLNILKGFKKAAEEKRAISSMELAKTQRQSKLQIDNCISQAQSCLHILSKKAEGIGQMSSYLSSCPLAARCRAVEDQSAHQIQAKIRDIEEGLEIGLLEEQLKAVGAYNELKSLLRYL